MKKKIDVARAWRDEEYYLSLTLEERASLGANPAGALAPDDAILKSVTGGCGGTHYTVDVPTAAVCSVCPPEYCT